MKSVLISIQPKWVEKIVNGEKTVEVRKSRPKIETPFKCYIYRTTEKVDEIVEEYDSNFKLLRRKKTLKRFSGKVIGEFVCDRIDKIGKRGVDNNFDYCYLSLNEWGNDDIEIEITTIKKSCITKEELNKYGFKSQYLYGWHISDLKIYDKPKDLGEFFVKGDCEKYEYCIYCSNFHRGAGWLDGSTCDEDDCKEYGIKPIVRPPQSWCYVEEL